MKPAAPNPNPCSVNAARGPWGEGEGKASRGVAAAVSPEGATPLSVAAEWGKASVVALLLAAGADEDKANTPGVTALQLATQNGEDEVVALLSA